MADNNTVALSAGQRQLVLSVPEAGGPQLIYWGPRCEDVFAAETFDPLPSSPDRRIERELFPLEGAGFFGEPALLAHKQGHCVFQFRHQETQATHATAQLTYEDSHHGVSLTLSLALHECGVLESEVSLANSKDGVLSLVRLNALTLPLPRWITAVDLTFGGWSSEGHHQPVPLTAGKIEQAGRAGRPGFDGGPHLMLCADDTSEQYGGAIGLALANSGNFTLAAERLRHGEAQAYLAEYLQPGEITLAPGETYKTPTALAAMSLSGFSALSKQFHAYARMRAPKSRRHRPVSLNSWEAAYFNVDEATAKRLAKGAADLGAERFVLDDGWFQGRDNDQSALGDWTPDRSKFPNGLGPLARYVSELGLDFGLWVEPEMINQDSALYRQHPDWVLSHQNEPGATARNQLVLDLQREEVQAYLFDKLDHLLTTVPIRYLKWDCNRDLFPSSTRSGPAAHRQIEGLYALLHQILEKHPGLSIESCASGGARIDFGVARYADRFWTSDSTDPFERMRIQRRASQFFPVEMLGAHVGASPNGWTGRSSSMVFRCLVAFFGHFGVELDPEQLSAFDRSVLVRAINLYKEYRDIIIDGELIRIPSQDTGQDIQLMLAENNSRGLLRVLRDREPARLSIAPIFIPCLPEGSSWRLSELKIDGPDIIRAMGSCSSTRFSVAGAPLDVSHGGEGRLFLIERDL